MDIVEANNLFLAKRALNDLIVELRRLRSGNVVAEDHSTPATTKVTEWVDYWTTERSTPHQRFSKGFRSKSYFRRRPTRSKRPRFRESTPEDDGRLIDDESHLAGFVKRRRLDVGVLESTVDYSSLSGSLRKEMRKLTRVTSQRRLLQDSLERTARPHRGVVEADGREQPLDERKDDDMVDNADSSQAQASRNAQSSQLRSQTRARTRSQLRGQPNGQPPSASEHSNRSAAPVAGGGSQAMSDDPNRRSSDSKSDAPEHVTPSSSHAWRPYLSRRSRNSAAQRDAKASSNLRALADPAKPLSGSNPTVHVPFSEHERLYARDLVRTNRQATTDDLLVKALKSRAFSGRSAADMRRYFDDNFDVVDGARVEKTEMPPLFPFDRDASRHFERASVHVSLKLTSTSSSSAKQAPSVNGGGGGQPISSAGGVRRPFHLRSKRTPAERSIFRALRRNQEVGMSSPATSRTSRSTRPVARHDLWRAKYAGMRVKTKRDIGPAINTLRWGTTQQTKHLVAVGVSLDMDIGEEGQESCHGMLLDTKSGEEVRLQNHENCASEVHFTYDGKYVVTGSYDHRVNMYSTGVGGDGRKLGEYIRTYAGFTDHVDLLCLTERHPDLFVAVANKAKELRLFSTRRTKTMSRYQFRHSNQRVTAVDDVAFGEKDTALCDSLFIGTLAEQGHSTTSQYHIMQVSEAAALRHVYTSKKFDGRVDAIHAHPTRSNFVMIASNNRLLWFDPREPSRAMRSHFIDAGSLLRTQSTLRGEHLMNNFSFSPCGNLLQTSAHDMCVLLHDFRYFPALGEPLMILEHDYTDERTGGIAAEFSPSSNFLVSGSDDCALRLWDVRCSQLDAEVAVVSSRDFGPDFGALCNLEFSRDSCEIVCGTVAGKIAVVTI